MILEEMLVTQIRTRFAAYWLGCFFGRLLANLGRLPFAKEEIPEKKLALYREIASKFDTKPDTAKLLKNELFEIPLRMFCIEMVDGGKKIINAIEIIVSFHVFSASQIDSVRFHLYGLAIRGGLKFKETEMENFERSVQSTHELFVARRILLQGIQGEEKRTGTRTWFVRCPSCGTEKRCDKNTKRYKCKCGFDSLFPLPS
jgi:hypothetical protein